MWKQRKKSFWLILKVLDGFSRHAYDDDDDDVWKWWSLNLICIKKLWTKKKKDEKR